MPDTCRHILARSLLIAILVTVLSTGSLLAQQAPDLSTVIRGIDASVKNRIDQLAGYTVTEHYVVFRGHGDAKQVADTVVETTFRKESGKTYRIISQSGSSFWRSEVLNRLLENERLMSKPGNVETALIDSSNYEMTLDKNSIQTLNDRQCVVLDISPRRSSEYLFKGELWVDSHDYAIVQLKGIAGKSAFFLTGAAEVTRSYTKLDNVPMATHAEAISGSTLLGQTTVKVDYANYKLNLISAR
jgi:hypothetical protein